MEDRLAAAQVLADEFEGDISDHILVDLMENRANFLYGGFPERAYIIKDGKIAFEGDEGPHNFNLDKLEACLAKLID